MNREHVSFKHNPPFYSRHLLPGLRQRQRLGAVRDEPARADDLLPHAAAGARVLRRGAVVRGAAPADGAPRPPAALHHLRPRSGAKLPRLRLRQRHQHVHLQSE